MSSASSAGLLLTDAHRPLQYMAASAESVKLLELFQLQYQEGPCWSFFRTGTAVVDADLHQAAPRWPLFAPSSGERLDPLPRHPFPLRQRQKVIGALNMFSTHTGLLEPGDVRILQSLASIATIGILQERSIP